MAERPRDETGPGRVPGTVLVLVAMLLLALNLRPAAVSVGPVLPDIQRDLGMSDTLAGVLTALPTLCFAAFGALAPWVARRIGLHRTVLVSSALIVAGQVARIQVHTTIAFLALSMVALAGMASANVLFPSLVKRHFPTRIGLITALYSTSLTIGLTVASFVTVPLAQALGGWRNSFLAGTLLAAIAVIPWILIAWHDDRAGADPRHIRLRAIARTRLGWIMVAFFALQSAMAYSVFGWLASIYGDAGYSPAQAGMLLGVLNALGIPLAFVWPAYMARNPRPFRVLALVMASGCAGMLGLLVAPRPLALGPLWALLLALGNSSFPMILALFGMRARTSQGTAALSGFTQSIGYLFAALGPFGVGLLHEVTNGWTVPLIVLAALFVPMSIVGYLAIGAGEVEDELR